MPLAIYAEGAQWARDSGSLTGFSSQAERAVTVVGLELDSVRQPYAARSLSKLPSTGPAHAHARETRRLLSNSS